MLCVWVAIPPSSLSRDWSVQGLCFMQTRLHHSRLPPLAGPMEPNTEHHAVDLGAESVHLCLVHAIQKPAPLSGTFLPRVY
jgi:hypothetical protein